MSTALRLYGFAAAALEPLAPALLRARARRGKEDVARLHERLGRPIAARPPGRLIWLHGASVGEGLSLLPLVDALAAADPEARLLVTSGTVASAALLAARLPSGAIHQFVPVDGPRGAARFLAHWRPALAVFAESELWPNLIARARIEGVKTALVSARLSQASLKGWGRAPRAARAMLGGFDLLLTQDDPTADGLQRLGARVDGRLNLKLSGGVLPVDDAVLAEVRAALAARPLLLAASTHPGEEAELLEVFAWLKDRPERPLLVVVPRHPDRGEAVAATARAEGFAAARRATAEPLTEATEVYIADTLGELGLWFRLACAAFIGGSLVRAVGGHNPLEASRLGCPAVSGPYIDNWRSVFHELEVRQAVRIVGGGPGLAGVFAEALTSPAALKLEAERARAFAAGQGEAVAEAARRLLALAGPPA